ncbi:MAG: FIST N-terminal domain-containing protein [Bacteroidota bacterium]
MDLDQAHYTVTGDWLSHRDDGVGADAHLVLAFGTRERIDRALYDLLSGRYPQAHVALCSTAGNILGTHVSDPRVSVTAVRFSATPVQAVQVTLTEAGDAYNAGCTLAERLAAHATADVPLVHVLVLSDGQVVNATRLVAGFNHALPARTTLSGGLAGDGDRFEETLVGLNACPASGVVAALGFYGTALRVGCGSAGGWAPFGPSRRVTRAEGTNLFELDGTSALELYRRYLGPFAGALPGAALRFPLELTDGDAEPVVRTILHIDDDAGTMTFAGSIPEGVNVRLMRASYENLVDGAVDAAEETRRTPNEADFALCISCVGRRIVLGQRIEDETEGVRALLGDNVALAGFYSYGELAPSRTGAACALHNQTMTITTFAEQG